MAIKSDLFQVKSDPFRVGSLRLRYGDHVVRLTEALDAYALDKTFKIEDFLFPLQKA